MKMWSISMAKVVRVESISIGGVVPSVHFEQEGLTMKPEWPRKGHSPVFPTLNFWEK